MKRYAIATMLAAAALAATLAPGAAAQSISTLEAQISDAQAEADSLGAEVQAKTGAIAAAEAEARAAAEREAELSAVLAEGQARLAELEERVALARDELQSARRRLERATDALGERLVAIYKGDVPDSMALLLEADGFDDLVSTTDYLLAIEEAEENLVEEVRALREEVAAQLASVEQARAEQEQFNAQLDAARRQIAGVRAAAEARAADLAAAQAAQADALASLNSRVDDWTAQVQELRAAQQAPVTQAEAEQEVVEWTGDWAIPEEIVMCESGGNYGAVNPDSGAGGAYQIMPETWDMYGGEGDPEDAPQSAQDQVAAQIWQDSGPSAWVCAG